MPKFVPKETLEDDWEQLAPQKSYAVLSDDDHPVYLKLGRGRSYYIGVYPVKPEGRLMNTIEYDSGDTALLYKLTNLTKVEAGRISECVIKIINPVISRKHLKFYLDGNILVVGDIGSTNGTYIYKENVYFSIDDYMARHTASAPQGETLDEIQMTFGVGIEDFFKRYKRLKEEESKENVPADPEKKEEDKHDPGQNQAV
jgi:hypothetical protein